MFAAINVRSGKWVKQVSPPLWREGKMETVPSDWLLSPWHVLYSSPEFYFLASKLLKWFLCSSSHKVYYLSAFLFLVFPGDFVFIYKRSECRFAIKNTANIYSACRKQMNHLFVDNPSVCLFINLTCTVYLSVTVFCVRLPKQLKGNSNCLSIWQFHLSVSPAVHPSVFLSIHPSIIPSVCPSLLPICLSIHPQTHPATHPQTHPFIHPSINPSF